MALESALPRTPTEQLLADLWSELLYLDRVGVDDNFFDLGGESLVAMALVTRINDARGVDLQVTDVFETPQLADLAARIDALDVER